MNTRRKINAGLIAAGLVSCCGCLGTAAVVGGSQTKRPAVVTSPEPTSLPATSAATTAEPADSPDEPAQTPDEPTQTPEAAGRVVTPGAFCSDPGSRGITRAGTSMVCSYRAGDTRARWRKG